MVSLQVICSLLYLLLNDMHLFIDLVAIGLWCLCLSSCPPFYPTASDLVTEIATPEAAEASLIPKPLTRRRPLIPNPNTRRQPLIPFLYLSLPLSPLSLSPPPPPLSLYLPLPLSPFLFYFYYSPHSLCT